MENKSKTPNLPSGTITRGFLSALLGAVVTFSVLMFSRGFVFDWVTYLFLAIGTLAGAVTFILTDYHDMKKRDTSSSEL